MAMFKRRKRRTGAEAAQAALSSGERSRPRQASVQVNGWVVYRGITPIATAATQQEAVDAAGHYLGDPAGGLMHLRPALGDELPPPDDAVESWNG